MRQHLLLYAAAAGKTVPAEMDQRRKGMIDNLRAATGAAFDKTRIDQQVAAHQEALTLHQGFADNGDDSGVRSHAAKVVPKVQMHLDQAKALAAGT